MRTMFIVLLLTFTQLNVFSQDSTNLKFIFIPHPRSDDQVYQSVHAAVEKIDFSKYDVTMLGGDLTWSVSTDRASLEYCDSLFDLGSPNTLWSLGNHDVSSGHRALIKEFTGRESYYTYTRNKVTFLVLDTELNANSFSETFIKGDQLQMVETVCDTIQDSRFLILLHHRLMWMINSDYFESWLDESIAASSRSLDTTNFYADIYPLLQKVKHKGIQVLALGGDRVDINITYSPEDCITYYAAQLKNEFSDSKSNAIVLNYNQQTREMTCDYIILADILTSAVKAKAPIPEGIALYQNYPNPFNPSTIITFHIPRAQVISLKIYDVIGREVASLVSGKLAAGTHSIEWNAEGRPSGIYFYQLKSYNFTETRKLILLE
ncbi:T9SS type A sorting domain-containing protein [candidate division KSB1 bacterium]|nr:T9SS type A sorting domain-containing protein [candidate division KSB1 bacterium]